MALWKIYKISQRSLSLSLSLDKNSDILWCLHHRDYHDYLPVGHNAQGPRHTWFPQVFSWAQLCVCVCVCACADISAINKRMVACFQWRTRSIVGIMIPKLRRSSKRKWKGVLEVLFPNAAVQQPAINQSVTWYSQMLLCTRKQGKDILVGLWDTQTCQKTTTAPYFAKIVIVFTKCAQSKAMQDYNATSLWSQSINNLIQSLYIPVTTLGIFVRKLFTVRIGTPPVFSSCIRVMISSIWQTRDKQYYSCKVNGHKYLEYSNIKRF